VVVPGRAAVARSWASDRRRRVRRLDDDHRAVGVLRHGLGDAPQDTALDALVADDEQVRVLLFRHLAQHVGRIALVAGDRHDLQTVVLRPPGRAGQDLVDLLRRVDRPLHVQRRLSLLALQAHLVDGPERADDHQLRLAALSEIHRELERDLRRLAAVRANRDRLEHRSIPP